MYMYIYLHYTCATSTVVDDIPTPIQSNLNTMLCMTNIFWITTSSFVLCCHFITSCHVATMNSQDLGLKFKQNRSKLPTPTHPIQTLAETLKKNNRKTSWYSHNSFCWELSFHTWQKNPVHLFKPLTPSLKQNTQTPPASLESPRLVVLCRQSPRPCRVLKPRPRWSFRNRWFKRDPYTGWNRIPKKKKNWVVYIIQTTNSNHKCNISWWFQPFPHLC